MTVDKEMLTRRFSNGDGFAVSEKKHKAGEKFSGIMAPSICYVVSGACKFTFHEEQIIEAGDFAGLAGGKYKFEVVGETDAFYFLVRLLPGFESSSKKATK
jgi:hypothetical protein